MIIFSELIVLFLLGYIFVFRFVLLCVFRAVLAAYGSSRLGAELELQLPAYTTPIGTWDPSLVCDLHHSSGKHRNPQSEARD